MLQIIVLAGGAGIQLWPLSREKMPKQFINLLDNESSLFQKTIHRLVNFKEYDFSINKDIRLIILCNESNKFLVKNLLDEIENCYDYIIVSEPINRSTAAAIAIGLELSNKDDDILIVPSDQIWDNYQFYICIDKMLKSNYNGFKFIGITPYYPATRFGYIQVDNEMLIDFKEKPDSETANEYVNHNTKNFLWNSGVLFFKNKEMIDKFKTEEKDLLQKIKIVLNNSDQNNKIISLNKELFSNIKNISLEKAILEKHKSGIVFTYNHYWTDIDSFKSLYDFLNKDKDYNLIQSKVENNIITIDTEDSFIYSDNKLVSTIGVKDLLVIDTYDSLLVANKKDADKISEVVKVLKAKGRSEHIINPICYKPWGWYLNLEGTDYSGYKVKKICIYSGKRLSLQSHKERTEHWVIVKGTGKVQLGDDELTLSKNQTVFIPKGIKHRVENISNDDLILIETQVGNYLGEDDITRYDDDFGR